MTAATAWADRERCEKSHNTYGVRWSCPLAEPAGPGHGGTCLPPESAQRLIRDAHHAATRQARSNTTN